MHLVKSFMNVLYISCKTFRNFISALSWLYWDKFKNIYRNHKKFISTKRKMKKQSSFPLLDTFKRYLRNFRSMMIDNFLHHLAQSHHRFLIIRFSAPRKELSVPIIARELLSTKGTSLSVFSSRREEFLEIFFSSFVRQTKKKRET